MITIRSPFCGYNTIQCAALYGEDLSRYSNKVESDNFKNVHVITDLPAKRI